MDFPDQNDISNEQRETGSTFAPKFDVNGLILAITTEARTGQVLMVAYMNEEALCLTLTTGIVHYYSRSRQSLWKKGETSGETQRLIDMRVDCDQDALLLSVEQTGRGAACHTGQKSCFYRKVTIRDQKPSLKHAAGAPLFDPKKVYDRG